jgi:hypothetical protein
MPNLLMRFIISYKKGGKPMTDKTKNTTAAVAGVAGAVVGAGVAVAATKLMSDKKMRDKVRNTFTQVKDQVVEALDHTAQINQKGGSASGQGKQKKLTHSKQSKSSERGHRSGTGKKTDTSEIAM